MPRTLDATSKELLGKNLRECRERKRWSQVEAAKRLGVPRPRLNLWENGHETPGVEGLIIMALAYECPIDQLLSGVDEDYDAMIETRIPFDAQQHYRATTREKITRLQAAMQLAVGATIPAPTTAEKPEGQGRNRVRGKSGEARARRIRPK